MTICPYCLHTESKVTDKRDTGSLTRRRRECLSCGKRFTTHEEIYKDELVVVKKDGRREIFEQNKLKGGILKAVEKRPVSIEDVDEFLREIEERLRKKGKEVNSKDIGKLVMAWLQRKDQVAYIRFASVYLDFKTINDFKKEIKTIK